MSPYVAGKMELFSKRFEKEVRAVFERPGISIVATVPVAKLPLTESLKSRTDCKIFAVTKENRDSLLEEILSIMTAAAGH